jgi:hypothetical protein
MVLGLLLQTPLSLHATVVLRPYAGAPVSSTELQTSSEAWCDDGSPGGTFVQGPEDWIGNTFVAACAGGRITSVRFQHLSYGLPGPYLFRLHLVDAACGLLASTDVVQIDASEGTPSWVEVDTDGAVWCVQGQYQVLLEPLTCAAPLSGEDCFPALVYDASSSTNPLAHCGRVSTQGAFERDCGAPRSADGRYFDFILRPQVQCAEPACATAVSPASWSLMKSLYQLP